MAFSTKITLLALVFGVATISGAHAAILSPAPNDPMPLDLTEGAVEAATLFAYNERRGVRLTAPMTVDIAIDAGFPQETLLSGLCFLELAGADADPGTADCPVTISNSQILDAGVYDSHLIRLDPIGTQINSDDMILTFDGPIVALIGLGDSLDATDSLFGNPGVLYDTLGNRRKFDDVFELLAPNRLHVFMSAGDVSMDELRVITESRVAAPAGLAAVLACAAGVLLRRRFSSSAAG